VLPKNLDKVIARRGLRLDGDKPVEVLIGKPYPNSETSNCVCPYQIRGIADERLRGAVGRDEFEAISHAVYMLGVHLRTCDEADRLSWDAGSFKGDLGFPSWPPATDLIRICGPKPD